MKIKQIIAALLGVASLSLAAQPAQQAKPAEQAVIVHFQYGSLDWSPLHELEDRIESAIAKDGVGEYDGNEVATDGSDGVLYMYGRDADALFETVRPVLETAPFMRGARAVKRYGPPGPGVKETTVLIGG